MKLTKSQLKQLIKEELTHFLVEQEVGPPEDPMGAYGQAQAEEGVQTAYDEAWNAYTTGMQELYNHARDIGNIIKPLYNKAAKSGDVEAAEGIRTLMAFTAVSGYRPPDGGPTLQGAISAFGDRVDAGLKEVGFRGPTNIDYLIGTTQPRHPAPDIMDVMNDRTWSGGKYSE